MSNAAQQKYLGRRAASLAILALVLAGCVSEIDTTRVARDDMSTGRAIYREMCNRVAVAADPTLVSGHPSCNDDVEPSTSDAARLQEIYAQKDRLISETNAAMDGEVGTDTRNMLALLLPLYDDDTIQEATRTLSDWLGDLQNDADALAALQTIARREGYTQPELTPGFLRVLMRFDGLGDLLQYGLEPITSTTDGTVTLANALSILGPELDGAFDEADDPTHTWFLVRDFLMQHDDALDDGNSRFIVQRDTTGTAVVTSASATAAGTPFPLAEATTTRTSADIRDRYGRLVDSNGNPLYDYIDIEGTVLSGLVREAGRIAKTSPGAIGQMGRLFASWLGPAKARSQYYDTGQVRFGGFDTSESPLLELVHAVAAIAKKDSLLPAMQALEIVAQQRPDALAAGTHALSIAAQRLREAPYNALHLEDDTALAEEMLALVGDVLREPGLAEQILNALEDPRLPPLGANFVKHMTYKDLINYDSNDFNRPPVGTMKTEVDRSQPDVRGNRSLFQRYIHLMHDSDTRVCNKQGATLTILGVSYPFGGGGYDECELNEIDSHGAFFAESIIGRAQLVFKDDLVAAVSTDSMIQLLTGIDDFGTYPTPQALARFCMVPFNAFLAGMYDPVPTRDAGVYMRDRHNGTIFVWELDDFYTHMTPLITAFSDHDRMDLFMRSATVVHRHYDSRDTDFTQSTDPSGLDYAPQTGLVRFEPVLAEAFDADLIGGLAELVAALRSVTVNGTDGRTLVLNLVRDITLYERNSGLTTRTGKTFVTRNDGAVQAQLTPVLLVLNAIRRMDDALPDLETQDAFVDGTLGLIGGLLDSDGATFTSTRTAPLTADILAFLRGRVQAHKTAGDLTAWADGLEDSFLDMIDQPLIQTGAPLLELMASTAEARAALDAFLVHLADESSFEAYTSTIQALADGMQLLDDETTLRPLARVLVTACDPKSGMMMNATKMLQGVAARDIGRALPQLFEHMVLHPTVKKTDETPLEALFDITLDVNRIRPGSTTSRTGNDYANAIGILRDFLTDQERGLERLYEIIANR